MKERITWRWRGREVYHPLAKVGIAVAMVVMLPIGFLTMVVVVAITIVTLPISIPLHFVLKAMGRKGFLRHEVKGLKESIRIVLDHTGFQKA